MILRVLLYDQWCEMTCGKFPAVFCHRGGKKKWWMIKDEDLIIDDNVGSNLWNYHNQISLFCIFGQTQCTAITIWAFLHSEL